MADRFLSSIVSIHPSRDTITGTGFLVSQKHVLTCAHLITQDTMEAPVATIKLQFPLIKNKKKSIG